MDKCTFWCLKGHNGHTEFIIYGHCATSEDFVRLLGYKRNADDFNNRPHYLTFTWMGITSLNALALEAKEIS